MDFSKDFLFGGVNVKIDFLIIKRVVEYIVGEEYIEKGNLILEDFSKVFSINIECFFFGDCLILGIYFGNGTNGVLESFSLISFF